MILLTVTVTYLNTRLYCNYLSSLRSEQISKNIMCSDMLKPKPLTESMNPRSNH